MAKTPKRDFNLMWAEADKYHYESLASYWAEVNAAREAQDSVAFCGLLKQATYEALAETDPTLKVALLTSLADLTLDFANAVERQTAAFNVEAVDE